MKNKILIFTVILGFLASGCKKEFLDINKNPNSATTATPELVLPAALANTAARLNPMASPNTWFNGWMGYWAISGSYAISTSDFTTYKQTTTTGDATWQGSYLNLSNYNFVEVQSKAEGKPFYEGAAKVMKAFNFQMLVDLFGDVPYTEAFGGTGNIHPKYDDQKFIYDDLIKQLDTAITLMSTPNISGDPNSDILFDGDPALWAQFANSLKLRILMRQSQVADRVAYVQAEIAKIVASDIGFLGEDAGVNPGYSNSAGKQNPFYGSNYNVSGTYTNDFWRANQYGIDFYKKNNDPRLTLVYGESGTGKYQGNSIGQISGLVGSDASIFGPGVLKAFDQDAIIMTAAESYFLQAEAALRGWLTDDAQALYEQGVVASFQTLGVEDFETAAADYVSQSGNKNTNWAEAGSFDEKLALIIRQKWAAMNTITPIETYADYRRLHLPADVPLSISPYVETKQVPYRLLYPVSEYRTNTENVNAKGTIDQFTTKIFWIP
ncbi:MAG TPA: SusD/RagB family nutrient-binding outer membrane lipoprotein [Niastella sp.]|nr:SusD/RagB family nutrient-binding outer membrane lipoprotein [Niastella sp.]